MQATPASVLSEIKPGLPVAPCLGTLFEVLAFQQCKQGAWLLLATRLGALLAECSRFNQCKQGAWLLLLATRLGALLAECSRFNQCMQGAWLALRVPRHDASSTQGSCLHF